MRVLRVIPTMNPAAGGPCQGIRNSIPAMQLLGCENDVVCMDHAEDTFGVEDPFTIHRIGRSRGPWAYCNQLMPWLVKNLSRYDAVIIHGLWLYHSFAVTRAVGRLVKDRAAAIPRVFVIPHGMLDPWFQRDPSRRLKAVRNWLVWKAIEHRVVAQADAVLFTCQKELELAREPFRPYRPKKEINVGYGVAKPPQRIPDMVEKFRASVPCLGNHPYLLFLSRIHPKKGVDLMLRAYAKLIDESESPSPPASLPEAGRGEPGSPCPELPHLVIAGPLDSDYAKQMQQLATDLKLGNVHFPGMLSGDAKWGAFYGCEAFVLPSHQENFGIAVVEALACGKPVLISDQVNICNEIRESGAGLVATDNAVGTRELMSGWIALGDPEKQTMGVAANACYQSHFQPSHAAAEFLRAISLVRDPANRSSMST